MPRRKADAGEEKTPDHIGLAENVKPDEIVSSRKDKLHESLPEPIKTRYFARRVVVDGVDSIKITREDVRKGMVTRQLVARVKRVKGTGRLEVVGGRKLTKEMRDAMKEAGL